MMVHKPFSKSLYEDDDNAKDLIVTWLLRRGYEARVNPDDYGIDVIAEKNGKHYEFEVEVKHNWKGMIFPFRTLHYADRKLKFLNPGGEKKTTVFITLNNERTHALTVTNEILTKSKIVTKDTIYTKGEKFIEVAIQDCYLIEIDE